MARCWRRSFTKNCAGRRVGRHPDPVRFYHYRDKDNADVDIVLEGPGGGVTGVEARDFRSLRKLREAAGKKFAAGMVLYDGSTCVGFGGGLFAELFNYGVLIFNKKIRINFL